MGSIDSPKVISGVTLGTIDLFRKLSISDRERLTQYFKMNVAEQGQYIISTKDQGTNVYFLLSGKVRVCTFSLNGKQVYFEDLLPGMMFGELAMMDGNGRSSDCMSVTPITYATIPASDLKMLIREFDTVLDTVLERLATIVRGNMQRVFEFSTLNVPQRVRCELLRLASTESEQTENIIITNAPTHAEIAARVSTHREAVTRELKHLESIGWITWKPRQHVIHDIISLSQVD
jgi:CRP-like cAMP-binding protein